MTTENNLQEFSNSINQLKTECVDAGISEEEFKEMYNQTLNDIVRKSHTMPNQRRCLYKNYKFLAVCVFVIIIVINFQSLYSCFVCNMQEYIYPGLRLLRKASIPFISLFPALTGKNGMLL